MADVFGRQDQILAGGLSSDSMFMSWPELAGVSGGGLGLLIQQIGLEYRQPVRRVFEIGPGTVPLFGVGEVPGDVFCDVPNPPDLCALRTQPSYYIIGRPEGRMQFSRFVGPQVIASCFYRKYGSACSSNVITLSGRAGCTALNAMANPLQTWVLSGVLIDGVQMNVTGQEMVIQEGAQAQFVGLNILVNGEDLSC